MTVRVTGDAVATWPSKSVTRNVRDADPEPVGVPLIAPVAGFRFNPAGSVPAANEKVQGIVPPTALRAAL